MKTQALLPSRSGLRIGTGVGLNLMRRQTMKPLIA